MAGVPFLSKVLALEGLVIRKQTSNRQITVDLSSYQVPNTALTVLLPYKSGTLLLAPAADGTYGQVLTTNADGTTAWIPIPSAPVSSVNGQTGAVVLTASDVGAIDSSEKGVANGVATLGSDGVVPYSQLPAIPGIGAPIDFYGSLVSDQSSGNIFILNSTIYKSFIAQVSVLVDDASDVSETFLLIGSNNGTTWTISPTSAGQNSGVSFSISSSGVLSFSDPAAMQKTISYSVQAIDASLEASCKTKEKGSSSSSSSSGNLFTVSPYIYKSFVAQVSVFVDAVTDLAETFIIVGANNGSDWIISQVSVGNSSGVSFSINSSGILSFSDPGSRAKSFSWSYDAVDSFIGKTSSTATSGQVLTISPLAYRGFTAQVYVLIDAATDISQTYQLIGANNGAEWIMGGGYAGQETGVNFSINSSGVLSFSDPAGQSKQISFRVNPISV
jgi:hypothetical protein